MNTIECIKTRRSVRRYTDEVISRQEIEELIDIARMAPSWKNTQTVRYVIVQDKEIISKIQEEAVLGFEYNAKTISQCNTLVVLTQVKGRCGYERDGSFSTGKGDRWEMFDAGIAAQTLCLAAHEKGIGSCIMGIFDDAKVASLIKLPEEQSVAAIITMGKPKFAPDPTPRKEVEELVTFL